MIFFKKFRSLILFIKGFILSIEPIWNFKTKQAKIFLKNSNVVLTSIEEQVLSDLNNFGVSVAHLDDFSGPLLNDFIEWKASVKNKGSNIKEFLIYYEGGSYQDEIQDFNESNPLIEFSVNQSILNIVNGYFGMFSRLIYLEMNQTKLIKASAELKQSQNFHRDPGINKCVKVFIYLNDVENGGGPFTYIKKSHKYGKYWKYFKQRFFGGGGSYPDLKSLTKVVDNQDIYEISGRAGTIIFADTTGIHRGGNSTKKTREMTTSLFYPPADLLKSKINFNFDTKILETSASKSFALNNEDIS